MALIPWLLFITLLQHDKESTGKENNNNNNRKGAPIWIFSNNSPKMFVFPVLQAPLALH